MSGKQYGSFVLDANQYSARTALCPDLQFLNCVQVQCGVLHSAYSIRCWVVLVGINYSNTSQMLSILSANCKILHPSSDVH